MQKILIATHNKAKLHEIREFLSDLSVELVSLSDLKIAQDVEEDGITYEENSQKKALFYSKLSGLPSLSDDGGLEISALAGEPGVRSRRWLGFEASDEELIDHLKKVSKSLPESNRRAKFVTVVTLALPTGEFWSSRGEIEGIISKHPLKENIKGFPYRSLFFLPELGKFYFDSELTDEEKLRYNHRLIAVSRLLPTLKEKL